MQLNQEIHWKDGVVAVANWLFKARDWLLEGLRYPLPPSVQKLLTPPEGAPNTNSSSLDEGRVYWTELVVPQNMQGKLEDIANLQLAALSPIPPSEAALAVASTTPNCNDHVTADIAVVRKEDIQYVREGHSLKEGTPIHAVRSDGVKATFGEQFDAKSIISAFFSSRILLIFLVFFSLFAALSTYTDRAITKYNALRADLAPRLRSISTLQSDISSFSINNNLFTPTRFLEVLTNYQSENDAGTELIVERLSLTNGQGQLSGWVSEQTDLSELQEAGSLIIRDDERAGWRRFSVSWSMESDQ
ncbi:MAG: hypothetical protein AAF986_03985 [Pseudomonadota bacterium]